MVCPQTEMPPWKQRCHPGWLHSVCMYAGTMQKQFYGWEAVIAGLSKAKREHDKSARHKSWLQSKKVKSMWPPQFLVVSKEAKVQEGSSGEVSSTQQ